MPPRHQVSVAALSLIKRFEGLRLAAESVGADRWMIGYGHTRSAREGASVSPPDAEALLTYDLGEIEEALNALIFTPLTQNQFDALASFVFNIGLDDFRASHVLRRLNEGALLQAACAMEMWRKADLAGEPIVVDALIRRRAAEKALFLTPEHGFVPAPSAIVRPRLDLDAAAAVPASRPVELTPELMSVTTSQDEPPPTATEQAVGAVSARLRAIVPDEEPANAFSNATDESSDAASEPAPFPVDFGEEPAQQLPVSAVADVEAKRASVRSIFDDTREESERPALTPLAILGALGLFLFGGGLFWAFNARSHQGLMGAPAVGMVIGFVGIACVASAVYFLLERLGSHE